MTRDAASSKATARGPRSWIAAAVAIFVLWGAGEESAALDGAAGGELYRQHCAVCHGFEGIAILPDTPSFGRGEGLANSDRDLLKVIENGKGQMPPWKKTLSAAERRAVIEYIRAMPGRRVFETQCAECHNKVQFARVLSAKLPPISELEKREGTIEVCRGTAVQKTIRRKETAWILRYMQANKEP